MSRYTLSINIKSDNKELLDNLMITLETFQGSLADVSAVELFCVTASDDGRQGARVLQDPTTTQRNLFLDKWMLSDTPG